MQSINTIILAVHIVAGSTALVSGPVAMVAPKGGKQHRRWGKVYFFGMVVVFVTAVFMSLYKDIPFLLMIAILSFYLVVSGNRALALKNLHRGQKVGWHDWSFAIVSQVFCIGLLAWGAHQWIAGNTLGIAAVVLGALGVRSTYLSMRKFIIPPEDKNHWLYAHVGGMAGGYIATVTAFMVVSATFLPDPWPWVVPAMIGVPLIRIWRYSYQKRQKQKADNRELRKKLAQKKKRYASA